MGYNFILCECNEKKQSIALRNEQIQPYKYGKKSRPLLVLTIILYTNEVYDLWKG